MERLGSSRLVAPLSDSVTLCCLPSLRSSLNRPTCSPRSICALESLSCVGVSFVWRCFSAQCRPTVSVCSSKRRWPRRACLGESNGGLACFVVLRDAVVRRCLRCPCLLLSRCLRLRCPCCRRPSRCLSRCRRACASAHSPPAHGARTTHSLWLTQRCNAILIAPRAGWRCSRFGWERAAAAENNRACCSWSAVENHERASSDSRAVVDDATRCASQVSLKRAAGDARSRRCMRGRA